MTTTRRLAAILAADVAGYSRLMAADEGGTLARFKLLRSDHLEPAIRARGGRIVGEAGDSLLVEFGAASEAVAFAVEVQEKLASLNAELPEDRRMRFRIGINLGEVIADGATIHGDGVNVAARLEKLAEPGGIVVADTVQRQAKGKVPWPFEDLGEKTLHNIAEPVRTYRIVGTVAATPAAGPADRRVSVAVLPFTNMSGDPEQEYFADGITEDLITALSKSRHLSVVARNSTFVFKGRSVKVQDAGRELGARYIVEGSVRKGGNRVRVTAQLIDAESGAHLWAERFDRNLTDIFAVQDEIVMAVAAQLGFSLIDAVATNRRRGSESALTAYDHFLRGRAAYRLGDLLETRDHYLNAVEADPKFATALAALSFIYVHDCLTQLFGLPLDEDVRLSRSYAERALAASQGDPMMHHLVGTAFMIFGELEKARHHLELAQELNPYYPYTTINVGLTVALMGNHTEGLEFVERSFWLEPRIAPTMRVVPMLVHYIMRDFGAAIADFSRFDNPYAYLYLILAACHAQLGQPNQATTAVTVFEARKPQWYDVPGFVRTIVTMCHRSEDKETWLEGFRKAGLID
jgi:TolB-like protein